MQDASPESLMLQWFTFLEGGSDIVKTIVPQNSGQHFHYTLKSLSQSSLIIQDSKTKIINTHLIIIFWK